MSGDLGVYYEGHGDLTSDVTPFLVLHGGMGTISADFGKLLPANRIGTRLMPNEAMTEIIRTADCGNSPKNRFVQDIAIALESGAGQPAALNLIAMVRQRRAAFTSCGRQPAHFKAVSDEQIALLARACSA